MARGRALSGFVGLSLALAALCLQAGIASAEFKLRYGGTSGHLVIFVHGLWGDPLESFTAKGAKSWLEMMHEDVSSLGGAPPLSTYSTATLGYPAGTSDKYSPVDITAKLMDELKVQPELEKHKAIYFVAHSFGGLVVEQLLVNANLSQRSLLAERTRAVFLVATPSQGAELADVAARLPSAMTGPLVVNLKLQDTGNFLRLLQEQWRILREGRTEAGRPIVFQCAYEKQKTLGAWIVPRQSIDSSCNAYPIDADHTHIVKPTNREAPIYQWLLRNLAALNRSPPKDARPPETAEAPKAKGPREEPPRAAPEVADPPVKPSSNGGKVAPRAPEQEDARLSEKPEAVAKGGKDTAAVAEPPAVAPPVMHAPAGVPVVRLAGLEPRLAAMVRLYAGSLQRKAKVLAKGGEDSAATHELHVSGGRNNRSFAPDCGSSVQWKLSWTLEFELVPLAGTAAPRRGKVTQGVCYGTQEWPELDAQALKAAVRAMIKELETWSIQ